jgi:hypothetical protein
MSKPDQFNYAPCHKGRRCRIRLRRKDQDPPDRFELYRHLGWNYKHRFEPWVFPTEEGARLWARTYLNRCNLSGMAGSMAVLEPMNLPTPECW